MEQEFITTIRKTLEDKPTEELRRLYEARDQTAWSPEAFEAMRQILARRGETVPLPSQGPLPATSAQPRSYGILSSRFIPGIVLGVVVGAVLVFLLQRRLSASPDEEFKAISDAKKAQVGQFLATKGSELSSYHATFAEETDVDKRMEAPYVGTIEFAYTVTKPEGQLQLTVLHIASAEYRYSKKDGKWIYKGCFLKQGGSLEEKELPLVNFPDVKAAFEK